MPRRLSTGPAIRPSMVSTTSTALTFAGKRRLPPAVQKVRDVGILLRLCGVELSPARVGDHFREDLVERLVGEGYLRGEALLILGERHAVRKTRPVVAREVVPGLVHHGVAQLASAVGTEVEEDHTIAVADRRCRFVAGRDNPGRRDEFVGDAAV